MTSTGVQREETGDIGNLVRPRPNPRQSTVAKENQRQKEASKYSCHTQGETQRCR